MAKRKVYVRKAIFFGLGSIGQRHLRLLREFAPDVQIFAFRSGRSNHPTPERVQEISSWEELAEIRPDVAFICNPTSLHIETARRCARLGMHLFLEKPIGLDNKGLVPLIGDVKKRKLTAYVAYPLRFHPGVIELRRLLSQERGSMHVRCVVSSYLPSWRPGTDHLQSYSAQKKLGGGVILDLSHEIDLMNDLFGKVQAFRGTSSRLTKVTKDAEDNADFLIRTKRATINLHMNFCSLESERFIAVDLPNKFYRLDFVKNELLIKTTNSEERRDYQVERDDIFLEQLKYFINHLQSKKMNNNLAEAAQVFQDILAMKGSRL